MEKLIVEVVVGAIVLNQKKEMLLVKGEKWGKVYSIPGGKVEFGETYDDAIRRELFEEIGVCPRDISLIKINESIFSKEYYKKAHFVILNFLCMLDKEKSIKCCEREISDYVWCDPRKALDEVSLKGSVREVIEFFVYDYK